MKIGKLLDADLNEGCVIRLDSDKDSVGIGEIVKIKDSKGEGECYARIYNILHFNALPVEVRARLGDILDQKEKRWVFLMGTWKESLTMIPDYDADVYSLDEEDLQNLDVDNSVNFAYLRSGNKIIKNNGNLSVGFNDESYLDHWGIFGWSRAGKTNSFLVWLGKTLELKKCGGICFDPHDEIGKKLQKLPRSFLENVFIVTSHSEVYKKFGINNDKIIPFQFNQEDITPTDLSQTIEFSDAQVSLMWAFFNGNKENWLSDIENEDNTENEEDSAELKQWKKHGTLTATKYRIRPIIESGIFTGNTDLLDTIKNGVRRGYWFIFDIGDIDDDLAQVLVCILAGRILESYKWFKKNKMELWDTFKPCVIVFEEAHNYIFAGAFLKKVNNIAKIAKQGRKFKVCEFIIEQDIELLDPYALNQIHNKIIHQTPQPKAREYLSNSTPYIDKFDTEIKTLRAGQGIFTSDTSFNWAVPIYVPKYDDFVDSIKKIGDESDRKRAKDIQDMISNEREKKFKK